MKTTQVLIIKYGEIALRGKNRYIYENMLMRAIKKNLAQYDIYVQKIGGRFIIETIQPESLIPHIVCIFGITSVVCATCIDSLDLDDIMANALLFTKQNASTACTFKVITNRANKAFAIPSNEFSAQVGAYILDNTEGLSVKMSKPELALKIEIREKTYIYNINKEQSGLGGLPPASSGKGVVLLSGGIDSPVAGWLAAKRGVMLTCVYFHSPPYTSQRAKEKVIDLAKRLAYFTGGIRLFVVPFTNIQLKLTEKVPQAKITIFLKRTMLNIAEIIAKNEEALALITGDSIGQVASQTLHSLAATGSGTALPIIRPLATYDKQEIIDIAKQIETFDISIRPYDDCCTLFLPPHPETKPKTNIIENIEKKLDLDELIDKAIGNAELFDI